MKTIAELRLGLRSLIRAPCDAAGASASVASLDVFLSPKGRNR